ncbi:FlgO family outer membrane protein [Pseudodesulfovibrio portus]|uniref:FlgO domain-containing protein n=1 Tax=Pseudodesulfovibrio portus TaxID=231439 RepID=A0ABM8AVR4_9BACT|nr:FlgO family outer membrane protein [Pseudodesulfovibrio portus]BDQ35562.1 hypothetical protein JCM14722_31040 [Pseudodesulfovibrio portus]
MHKAALTILAAATLLFASGCGNRMWEDGKKLTKNTYNYVFDDAPTAVPYHDVAEIPMIEINHDAADILSDNVGGDELSSYSAVYIYRFINQVSPDDTAVFGQVVATQVADRLVQQKLRITEGEPGGTDYLYAGDTSEADYMGLTDKKADKLPPRVARLTGSYVIGNNFIYLSAKITRLVDRTVISAHNWTIPISDNVREMLPQLKNPDEGMAPTVMTKFE